MPRLAAVLCVTYLLLVVGVRVALHKRRTRDWGLRILRAGSSAREILAEALFLTASLGIGAAPFLAWWGTHPPMPALDHPAVHLLGLVVTSFGIVVTFLAQSAMRESWRIGVDASERTALVTTGPFAIVRNPIFSSMMVTALGLALLVPSVTAWCAFATLLAGIELQVRTVEEPYLRRVHGSAYSQYAARVGRFLPGIGRIRNDRSVIENP